MKKCHTCRKTITEGTEMLLQSKIVCEDCYIDTRMPKMRKAYYNNGSEFMWRLKDSYSVRKQRFH